jgi:hypothetical protein
LFGVLGGLDGECFELFDKLVQAVVVLDPGAVAPSCSAESRWAMLRPATVRVQ